MSFGAGKLLVGGAGSVGITTGLMLLVVPYLKPEEASANTSIVLASEEESIDPLEPPREEPEAEEEEEEEEEIEEGDEGEDEVQSESENGEQEPPTVEEDESENNDNQEGENNDDKDAENSEEKQIESNSIPSLPAGGNTARKTRIVKLKINRRRDFQPSLERLTRALGQFFKNRS